jgi:hypothetical protein
VLGLISKVILLSASQLDHLLATFSTTQVNPGSAVLMDFGNADAARLADSAFALALVPGLANCMTKMLNGFNCAEELRSGVQTEHLDTAKRVLYSMAAFGMTDRYKTSVCQIAWHIGVGVDPAAQVKARHFQVWRGRPADTGNEATSSGTASVDALSADRLDELSTTQRVAFEQAEWSDLALFTFAEELFEMRRQLTGCPMLESD